MRSNTGLVSGFEERTQIESGYGDKIIEGLFRSMKINKYKEKFWYTSIEVLFLRDGRIPFFFAKVLYVNIIKRIKRFINDMTT